MEVGNSLQLADTLTTMVAVPTVLLLNILTSVVVVPMKQLCSKPPILVEVV